jgi:hypothetical protein
MYCTVAILGSGEFFNEFAKKVLDFLNDCDVVLASVHQDI